jgi:hypothetical protein
MKKIVLILCAAVAVFAMTSCTSKSPSATVEAYYKALQIPDYAKALSYTDITDQGDIEAQIEKFEAFKIQVGDFEVVSETISEDGKSAVVKAKYTLTSTSKTNPVPDEKELNLVKVDGKWKIHA